MPRSRAQRSPAMPGMMSGPTKAPAVPSMRASTPRLQPMAPSKVQSAGAPKGSLAPPVPKAQMRPKTPKVPMPSPANQGPNASTNKATTQSLRRFGKQQRRVRMAMGKQAGNVPQRAGLPSQPVAGNAIGSLPQTPDASSIAGTEDATY